MVDLKRDLTQGADVELVRVTTTDPDPSYLRITRARTPSTATAWRPSSRDIPRQAAGRRRGRPAARPGPHDRDPAGTAPPSAPASYFKSRWLPTPYPVASRATRPGDWRYDRSTLDFISAADNQTTAGLHLPADARSTCRPTAAELADATPAPASVFTPNTALPARPARARSRTLAQQRHRRARRTKFEQAVALQQWFRVDGGFRYSLGAPAGNGTDDLVQFLSTGKDGRVGYCEQFAAAMALMGRTLGIPSRVAVGFLRPEQVGPRHLRLQLARPARLAGDVLRRRRLGALRADPAGPHRRRPGVHHPAGAAAAPPRAAAARPGGRRGLNRIDRTTDGRAAANARRGRLAAGQPGRVAGLARGAAGPGGPGARPARAAARWSGAAAGPRAGDACGLGRGRRGARSATPPSTSASPGTTT